MYWRMALRTWASFSSAYTESGAAATLACLLASSASSSASSSSILSLSLRRKDSRSSSRSGLSVPPNHRRLPVPGDPGDASNLGDMRRRLRGVVAVGWVCGGQQAATACRRRGATGAKAPRCCASLAAFACAWMTLMETSARAPGLSFMPDADSGAEVAVQCVCELFGVKWAVLMV